MLQLNNPQLQPNQKVVPAAEYQAYLDAEQIIAAAREEAAKIVAKSEEVYEAQRKQGLEDGLNEGRLEMAERMVDAVAKSVDYFSELEGQIVGLVIKALRKILGEMDERERIVKIVQNALAVARNQPKVTVRVSPGEVFMVQDRVDDLLRPYPAVQFLDVVSDSRLSAGGCILETDTGVIDASIDVQIKAIERSLQKSLGGQESK